MMSYFCVGCSLRIGAPVYDAVSRMCKGYAVRLDHLRVFESNHVCDNFGG